MKKYLLILVAGCLIGLFSSVKSCLNIQKERDRLADNQRSLLDGVSYYQTKDSLSAASVEKLTLTNNELERYSEELTNTVRNLGIKINRLESVSRHVTQTELNLATPIRDTLIIFNETPLLAKAFNWKDNWVSVSGVINKDTVLCRVISVDTLVQVVHRVPKKFLFIKWGTKAIRQEIVSKNPHSKIIYTEYIEMKK